MGKIIFDENLFYDYTKNWSNNKPVIDDVTQNGDFNSVTGALASVGLGDVPVWLRPFKVLSNGEQFRVGLARITCEKPEKIVIDEFTSAVDRQIAKIGSQAFQKAWRRSNPEGKVVLLTPHYDILDWVCPDWVIDTKTKIFERGRLRQRPKIKLEIFKTNGSYWKFFKLHYYLDLPMPIAVEYYVGTVNGELTCHLDVSPNFQIKGYSATRMLTMPEWQGAGVGMRFLEWVCENNLQGASRKGKKFPTYFHTSHPQLCAALRRSKKWIQKSSVLCGGNKKESKGNKTKLVKVQFQGMAGHFRAVQGFKYVSDKL